MTRWVFNEDGWTDWINHDGKGCPCVGWMVQARWKGYDGKFYSTLLDGRETFIATGGLSWYWGATGYDPIIRYRVRKPKGAEMLEQLVQNTDMPIKEMV